MAIVATYRQASQFNILLTLRQIASITKTHSTRHVPYGIDRNHKVQRRDRDCEYRMISQIVPSVAEEYFALRIEED